MVVIDVRYPDPQFVFQFQAGESPRRLAGRAFKFMLREGRTILRVKMDRWALDGGVRDFRNHIIALAHVDEMRCKTTFVAHRAIVIVQLRAVGYDFP